MLRRQITCSYEGPQHELRNDQAAIDYSFMLPLEQDARLFHVDACAAPSAGHEQVSLFFTHLQIGFLRLQQTTTCFCMAVNTEEHTRVLCYRHSSCLHAGSNAEALQVSAAGGCAQLDERAA